MAILEKITEDELDLLETFFYPPALAECLFSDFRNTDRFELDKNGYIRPYQIPMLSYEHVIDLEREDLTKQELFDLRKGASECYNLGGRGYGKSLIFHIIDLLLRFFYSLYSGAEDIIFSAPDWNRIEKILEKVKVGLSGHPLFKILNCKIKSKPYQLKSKVTGLNVYEINMTVMGQNPGSKFFGEHAPILLIEEGSAETEQVYNYRQDSEDEFGQIVRVSGMTNFTPTSPPGKAYNDPDNKSKLVNLPQKVNPNYNEQKDKKRQEKFGGKTSIHYRTFIDAEVVSDGCSAYDLERIGKCIIEDKPIISIDINKDTFKNYKKDLARLERPKNADKLFIASDISDVTTTEIIVVSEVRATNESLATYNYRYNITLYGITDDEQKELFKWLLEYLKVDVCAIDCGEATGRAICNYLEPTFPQQIFRYDGSFKIEVDYEKDDDGKVIIGTDGKPNMVYEYMSEFSVKNLQTLFYNTRINIPYDAKFIKQFSSIIPIYGTKQTIYRSETKKDHLHDAFRVFSIAQWKHEFTKSQPATSKKFAKGFY